MSHIGRLPIQIPDGVEVKVLEDNTVVAKGPKGELSVKVHPDITVEIEDKIIRVKRPTDQKRHKSMHGLYRTLIANIIEGVSKGYKKSLEVIGVGYRAEMKGDVLELALGYSHGIVFIPPPEIKISVERGKDKTLIHVEGIDKALVGEVAAKIRALRKPNVYTGKGIRYVGEYVRRKPGKAAAKK